MRIEDRFDFKEMFWMDIIDFEYVLSKISDIISPKERLGGTDPIQHSDKIQIVWWNSTQMHQTC